MVISLPLFLGLCLLLIASYLIPHQVFIPDLYQRLLELLKGNVMDNTTPYLSTRIKTRILEDTSVKFLKKSPSRLFILYNTKNFFRYMGLSEARASRELGLSRKDNFSKGYIADVMIRTRASAAENVVVIKQSDEVGLECLLPQRISNL